MIETDLCIVGSGPVALFAVYDAGQFGMQCHLIGEHPDQKESVSSVQHEKLIMILMEKIAAYRPSFSNGEWIENIVQMKNEHYLITTNKKTKIRCKSLVFANKSEHFTPNLFNLENKIADEPKNVCMGNNPQKIQNL